METSDVTIWRYIDLARFVSLLAEEALYFACPTELRDPYEGYLPRSHFEALSGGLHELKDDMLRLRRGIATQHPDADLRRLDDGIARMPGKLRDVSWEATRKFGVSCWHKSEHESEALWRLYSGSGGGVCIESTAERLTESLGKLEGLTIDSVSYVDFDRDPIEKGHGHYVLFMKRKSFEHEKELRAAILLKEPGQGQLVHCDLEKLISRIHISPFAEPCLRSAVERLCAGSVRKLDRPVVLSRLLDKPDYGFQINLDRGGKEH
jgi:hypothetical protein